MSSRPPGTLRLLVRPSMFLLHLPAVAAVVVAVLLGSWQLGAWQEHRQDRSATLADAAPVPLGDVLGPDDVFPADGVGRPVELTGEWLSDSFVYVADRTLEGRNGFWMVVPVLTCGTSGAGCDQPAAIPVVTGWTPTMDPAVDDAAEPPTGTVELTGWLQPGEGAEDPDGDPADRVLASLRIAELSQRVDADLYGGYVILESPADVRGGLSAVTPDSLPEAPTSTGLRNLLYGVEWWLFAGFAVFLWWRWTKDEVEAVRARESVAVTSVSADAGTDADAPAARIPSEP